MIKTQIELLTVNQIIKINRQILLREKQDSLCLNRDKIDSALSAAFYPGDYPFQYGGIAKVAGALCYFITKAHAFLDGNKRTAGISSTAFMELNGYQLAYPLNIKKGINKFADVIDHTAANIVTKDGLIEWFDIHKQEHNQLPQKTIKRLKTNIEAAFGLSQAKHSARLKDIEDAIHKRGGHGDN